VSAPASVVLFRALIIASVVTGLLGGLLDLIFPNLVPESLSKAFDELPGPPMLALVSAGTLVLVTFGGIVAATVGLYLFQPWARPLAVWMTLLGLLFHPLLGVSLQSGFAQLLLDLSSLLWGGVIAMSFVSSLSVRFAPAKPLA
jgi:hypothetical protein